MQPQFERPSLHRTPHPGALVTQFTVGALRSWVTASRWWVSGLEMLPLGLLVALVAYGTGAGIASAIGGNG